jgi:hypothetical protein
MKLFIEPMKEGNLFHKFHWKKKWKWLVKEKETNEKCNLEEFEQNYSNECTNWEVVICEKETWHVEDLKHVKVIKNLEEW